MKCPFCGCDDTQVKDSRNADDNTAGVTISAIPATIIALAAIHPQSLSQSKVPSGSYPITGLFKQ